MSNASPHAEFMTNAVAFNQRKWAVDVQEDGLNHDKYTKDIFLRWRENIAHDVRDATDGFFLFP